MKNIFNTKTLLSLSLLLTPACLFAQDYHHHHPTLNAPLDGGLSLLVVAGVGYGVKKYAEKKKAKSIQK
jgi:hypothetical protein